MNVQEITALLVDDHELFCAVRKYFAYQEADQLAKAGSNEIYRMIMEGIGITDYSLAQPGDMSEALIEEFNGQVTEGRILSLVENFFD